VEKRLGAPIERASVFPDRTSTSPLLKYRFGLPDWVVETSFGTDRVAPQQTSEHVTAIAPRVEVRPCWRADSGGALRTVSTGCSVEGPTTLLLRRRAVCRRRCRSWSDVRSCPSWTFAAASTRRGDARRGAKKNPYEIHSRSFSQF
jgi:hypothetical protein